MTKLLLKPNPGGITRLQLTITTSEALVIIKGLSALIVQASGFTGFIDNSGGGIPSVSAGVNGQKAYFALTIPLWDTV